LVRTPEQIGVAPSVMLTDPVGVPLVAAAAWNVSTAPPCWSKASESAGSVRVVVVGCLSTVKNCGLAEESVGR